MATYAIGDIQGCYNELQDLLDHINYDQGNDQLWFCGDLVNRGPASLDTLRFVKSLGPGVITALGNHDLHLLAVAWQVKNKKTRDTLDEILDTPDKEILLDWLRHQRLIYHDHTTGYTLIHAGLPPQWDLHQSIELAQEAESVLRGDSFNEFLDVIYGNHPDHWTDKLKGHDRIRFIINCFSRLRYCTKSGKYDLGFKGPPGTQKKSLYPWFSIKSRKTKSEKIIFGHWSTVRLGNITDFKQYNVYPLDTGCLWGGELTALRLEDEKWFSVTSKQAKVFK